MIEEEDPRPQRMPPKKKDLTPLSIVELETYIGTLEDEIGRARAEIAAKKNQRGGAESLFKRK
jgi:uncharacterized small protein (DUF1192 family)